MSPQHCSDNVIAAPLRKVAGAVLFTVRAPVPLLGGSKAGPLACEIALVPSVHLLLVRSSVGFPYLS